MQRSWATSSVDLHLEVDGAVGRRCALELAIRAAVGEGRLAARTRLPSTRALAGQLGLSRGTVSAAYDQLIAEGYLVARRGAGTEVADLAWCSSAPALSRADTRGPRYDLRPGRPDVTNFPTSAWLRASRRALTGAPASIFTYGDPRGRIELRRALANYLGRTRGVHAGPEQIVLTSGYVQGLALLSGVLAGSGPAVVAVEDPNLPFHREVIRRAGPTVIGVRVDDRGICAEELRGRDAPAVAAVVVTAAHQYPTGVTLHPDRRHELIRWARSAGGLIIEDDYDGEFRYDRQPVGAIQGMAPDCVAYLGTASKTLGPALRLGWMVLPPELVDAVVDAKLHADHHSDVIGQLVLAELITTYAYDRHVRASRLRYWRRRDYLDSRFAPTSDFGPVGFRLTGIAAGLHAVLALPPGVDGEQEVRARAEARGLAVGWLGEHWHSPGGHPQGIIIGFATPSDLVYPAAISALEEVLSPS
ncbi:MAG: MocR-like pyridoxine biosynthesis transcription factor PdxR [Candidatus Dormibacteria bacterium]